MPPDSAEMMIAQKLDELAKGQATLNATVSGLTGEVQTALKQHGEEIQVLFKKVDRLDGRVRNVELDYVPDEMHKRDMDENRGEHREFREGIDDQRSFRSKMSGMGVIVGTVLGGLGALLLGVIVWGLSKL